MTGQAVPEGVLFYSKTRRRLVVAIDEELRRLTLAVIDEINAMLAGRMTPLAVYEA